jgi:sugar lactone lactonase YvrE
MSRTQEPRVEQFANAILGESPIWHPTERVLYWADISRPAIYRYDPAIGQTGNWPLPSDVGAFGFRRDGGLIVATEHEGIGTLDTATGILTPLVKPGHPEPGRFNDGRVDPAGRFWVGWVTHARKNPGALFRVDPDGHCVAILLDLTASNGLGWSPDGRTMYVTDSHIGTIWAFDFDIAGGGLSNRRPFYRRPRSEGVVDGLSVDRDGCVWTALYDGWAVLRLDPRGDLLERIPVPVALTTSCCFGGPGLDTLFLTSGVRKQTAPALLNQPWAGALLSMPVAVPGLPEPLFG